MAVFSAMVGVGALLLFGDGLLRLLRPVGVVAVRGAVEAAGMRILLGLAMIPFWCMVMDLTAIPITRVSLLLAMGGTFLGGLLLDRKRPRPIAGVFPAVDFGKLRRSPAALVLILALASIVVASAVQISLYPPRSYDALVGYDLVGKVMAYEGKVRSTVFTNIDFNAQCVYAPFTALNQGYWYLFFPSAPRFWVPLLTAGFCLVMWSRTFRWTGSLTAAGFATFLVFLPPTLTYHLTVGQTDLPAMVFATLSFFSAVEALRGRGGIGPVIFHSLLATSVRSEGVLFAAALTLVGLVVARNRRWGWIWVTLASVAFFAFWNVFIVQFLIGYDPGEYFRRTIDFDPARMAEVIQRAGSIFATRSLYGEINWLIVLFPAFWTLGKWGAKRGWLVESEGSRNAALLFPILIVCFIFYLPFFYQWNPDLNPLWTMTHTLKRGFFRFIPALIVATVATPPVLLLLRRCEPQTEPVMAAEETA